MNILNSFQNLTDISLATAQPIDLSMLVVGEFRMGLAILQLMLFLVSLFLILLVLIQRGKGGGLTGALGGGGGESAFGSKSGDAFTKITVGTAIFWITLCMVTIAAYNAPETAYGRRAAERQAEEDAAQKLLPSSTSGSIGAAPGDADPNATTGGIGAPAGDGETEEASTTDAGTEPVEGDASSTDTTPAESGDAPTNEDSN